MLISLCFTCNLSAKIADKDYQQLTDSLKSLVELRRQLLNLSGLGVIKNESNQAMAKLIEEDLLMRLNLTSTSGESTNLVKKSVINSQQFKQMYSQYVNIVKEFMQKFEQTEQIRNRLLSV